MSFQIKTAEFITSVVDDKPILHDGKNQVAFIGRSNVGKSSVMNMLMDRRDLVKSSSTPGKTKTANFFLINNSFYLVDLPGYGYARMSKVDRERLRELIVWFLSETPRDNRKVVLVVDAKTGLTDIDLQMIEFLQQEEIAYIIAANKTDKLNQKELHKLRVSLEEFTSLGQQVFYVSAQKKKGRDALLDFIT